MFGQKYVHAICLGHQSNVVSSSNSTQDWCLLLVVSNTLACIVCAASLRNLNDNGGFDIPFILNQTVLAVRCEYEMNRYRAASKTALAVEEEVTFCGRFRLELLPKYQDCLRLPKKGDQYWKSTYARRPTGMANLIGWLIDVRSVLAMRTKRTTSDLVLFSVVE